MKQKLLLLLAIAFFFASCNNEKKNEETKDKTAEVKPAEDTPPPDSATMMKNWQTYMTPGDMHKMMASLEGTWEGDISMWQKPGDPPQKMMGTAIYKPIFNGLYVESVHKGMMMGMPFEGHGIMAYDNAKKKFISTWIDNMGSGVMMMEGPWDEATKSMTLTGRSYEPMRGKDCDFKEVFTMNDNDHATMEMYGPAPDGKEMKMMEIKSTRKK